MSEDIKETLVALLKTQTDMNTIVSDAAITGTIELDVLQKHITANQSTLRELILKIGDLQDRLYSLKEYIEKATNTNV